MSPDRKPSIPSSPTDPLVIQERISAGAIEALMRNYRDPQLAFMDLVDNAVDNRIDGKPITIRIRVNKDELSVSNHGGAGLDYEGLENYFTWGHSDKRSGQQIGQFGVGGKAAMGFLGRGMEIACRADGTNTEYRISDNAWESRREGELRQYETKSAETTETDGYFKVKITDLKSEINATALTTKLGDVYRPLLIDGAVKIILNGKEVQPSEIKYLEEDGLESQTLRVQTRLGTWINIKVGILSSGQRVKPGIRCYYRGRLIEDEQFFGHLPPSQFPASSRLIGEADLDFVPVTPNKSNFIRGSAEWDAAARGIHTALTPWMEKLSSLKNTEQTKVEQYEKDLARRAKKVLEHVLASTELITKRYFPGESNGRLPATPRGEIYVSPVGKPKQLTKPREGRTAPKLEARGEVKRWGAMHDVEPVSMGNPDKRAEIVEEGKRKILKVNSDYPVYQAAKGIGDVAYELYIAETLAMELAAEVCKDKSVKEYVDLVNELIKGCGEIYRQRVKENRPSKRR